MRAAERRQPHASLLLEARAAEAHAAPLDADSEDATHSMGPPLDADGEDASAETPLLLALERRNDEATSLLRQHGARLSDCDWSCLCRGYAKPTAGEKHLARLVGGYRWHADTHWSFPTTDRHTINVLTAHARRGAMRLPLEVWLHVLSFVERGAFAGRAYLPNGRPWVNVLPQNVLA